MDKMILSDREYENRILAALEGIAGGVEQILSLLIEANKPKSAPQITINNMPVMDPVVIRQGRFPARQA